MSPSDQQRLVEAALKHLADAGLTAAKQPASAEAGHDLLLDVTTPTGTSRYAVEVKATVTPAVAATLDFPAGEHPLLVASYIPEPIALSLRDRGIHYVDSAGNMHLRGNGLLVDVRGRRPPQPPTREPDKQLRMYGISGLKILFALFIEPDLVSATYRDIGQASGTSLGTVQWVLRELDENNHLSNRHGKRRLYRIRDLFNRWTEAYTLRLRPRLTLARFDAPDPEWWKRAAAQLLAEHVQWGGETAAYHLDPHLRPGRAVIYASAIPNQLVLDHRFRRAAGQGDVEIRQRFWRLETDQRNPIVPTPLIYADLVASSDPRQLEAAIRLRERDDLLRRLITE